jgi:hypothetical protein
MLSRLGLRLGILGVLLVAGLAWRAGLAAAQTNPAEGGEVFYVVVSSAYARAEPVETSAPVFSLFRGNQLPIADSTPDGQWLLLSGWSGPGWVQADYGITAPAGEPAPELPPLGPVPDLPAGVLPQLSPVAAEYYNYGLSLGNNPAAFSKLGDCNTENGRFLVMFDPPADYRLGEYAYLQPAIDNFSGSFSRVSLAAYSGFSADAVLDPTWADPALCQPGESPLACEFRLHRPSLALVNLGTHSPPTMTEFEDDMRRLIEASLAEGVLPILATKGDDVEGGDRVNTVIRALAAEYQLPLWDLWAAVQPLPAGGLTSDGIHFTFGRSYFDDPWAMSRGWTVRNLTALLSLDTIWTAAGRPGLAEPAAPARSRGLPPLRR